MGTRGQTSLHNWRREIVHPWLTPNLAHFILAFLTLANLGPLAYIYYLYKGFLHSSLNFLYHFLYFYNYCGFLNSIFGVFLPDWFLVATKASSSFSSSIWNATTCASASLVVSLAISVLLFLHQVFSLSTNMARCGPPFDKKQQERNLAYPSL